jgi:hypothetical protein
MREGSDPIPTAKEFGQPLNLAFLRNVAIRVGMSFCFKGFSFSLLVDVLLLVC